MFVSAVTGCVSISDFVFLVGIPIGIESSPVGLKISAIVTIIKKFKSIIKKKRKKHDKKVLLAKTKLNTIEVFSKALIYSDISHNEFVLVNYVLEEYNVMKEEIKNPNNR